MSLLTRLFFRRLLVEGPVDAAHVPAAVSACTAVRRWRPVRVGDVVVVRDPRDPSRWLLKRCAAKSGGCLELRGDNVEASSDSRDFGAVASRGVKWLVLRHQGR